MKNFICLFYFLQAFTSFGIAKALFEISFTQAGEDTVVSASGFLDVTALHFNGGGGNAIHIIGSPEYDQIWSRSEYTHSYRLPDFVGPKLFESTFQINSDVFEGDSFGVSINYSRGFEFLSVPQNFLSGNINGIIRYESTTLEALGFNERFYSWGDGPGQSLLISTGSSPIPESSLTVPTFAFISVLLIFICRKWSRD